MILVFGQNGQVARELRRLAPEARFLSRQEADLANPLQCEGAIIDLQPNCVINAAAYTAVDQAESEEALARTVNADAPAAMASACAELAIPFVHISTDYVFDGSGETPLGPQDAVGPINAYGRTKELGEQLVRQSGAVHAILRTSWVFSAHGRNFATTMASLGRQRDKLAIVSDQVGGPTPAAAIAQACLVLAEVLASNPGKAGTYHFSGYPDVSWADFAREIFQVMEVDVEVEDIPSSDYPTPAKRPLNSRLDCSKLSTVGLERPDWRAALPAILDSMEQK